ncbi:MAG: MBL fold metallo-hydrolase [Nocardioidaceae bacterium]
MDITIVGSGDAFGSGGRFQTCFRLHGDGHTVLVDCGATSLTALKSQGFDPGEVDLVALTHLHADHFGGLPFLILDGQFARRSKRLTVAGPAGTATRVESAMETAFPGSTSVQRRFDVDVVELNGDGAGQRIGDVRVDSREVDHPSVAPALALQARLGTRAFG